MLIRSGGSWWAPGRASNPPTVGAGSALKRVGRIGSTATADLRPEGRFGGALLAGGLAQPEEPAQQGQLPAEPAHVPVDDWGRWQPVEGGLGWGHRASSDSRRVSPEAS